MPATGGVYGVTDQMLLDVPGLRQAFPPFFVPAACPSDRNLINFYADGGLVYKGLVPHRPDDRSASQSLFARVGNNARGLDADTAFFSGNPLVSGAQQEA